MLNTCSKCDITESLGKVVTVINCGLRFKNKKQIFTSRLTYCPVHFGYEDHLGFKNLALINVWILC